MKKGIVLEGGGMRGMFTCGVVDTLLHYHIEFDALAGVSAGVLFGCNYKSRQKGRGIRYNLDFKDDRRYMSWHSLFTTGDYVNAHFAYHVIPTYFDPFDREAFRNNPMEFYAICADIVNGKPAYKKLEKADDDDFVWLRASASMPLFAKPVQIDGYTLLDGGLVDSIPLRFLQKRGCEKNLVVLTQPKGYRKQPTKITPLLKLFLHKYPKVAELMKYRHIMYNQEIEYVESEAAKGNTLVIYPEQPLNIGRIEQDAVKMKAIYQQGREVAESMILTLKQFLNS